MNTFFPETAESQVSDVSSMPRAMATHNENNASFIALGSKIANPKRRERKKTANKLMVILHTINDLAIGTEDGIG